MKVNGSVNVAAPVPDVWKALQDPAVLNGPLGADYYKTVEKMLGNASPLSQGPSGEEMIQAVGTELNEAVAGTKSVDDALAAAQAAAEKIQG